MTHYTKDELKKNTVPKLKEMCKNSKIPINSKMRKEDYIDALCNEVTKITLCPTHQKIKDMPYKYISDTKRRRVLKMYNRATSNTLKINIEEKLLGYILFEEANDIRTEKYTPINIRKTMGHILQVEKLVSEIIRIKKIMSEKNEQYKNEVSSLRKMINLMNRTQLESYKIGDVRLKLKKRMGYEKLVIHPSIFRKLCWEFAEARLESL